MIGKRVNQYYQNILQRKKQFMLKIIGRIHSNIHEEEIEINFIFKKQIKITNSEKRDINYSFNIADNICIFNNSDVTNYECMVCDGVSSMDCIEQ